MPGIQSISFRTLDECVVIECECCGEDNSITRVQGENEFAHESLHSIECVECGKKISCVLFNLDFAETKKTS